MNKGIILLIIPTPKLPLILRNPLGAEVSILQQLLALLVVVRDLAGGSVKSRVSAFRCER